MNATQRQPTVEVVHELKCHPGPFQAVKDGSKPFEWRKDDRGYQVGDTLWLREWDPAVVVVEECPLDGTPQHGPRGYTGDELRRTVTHIIREEFGIPDGYCIMALAAAKEEQEGPPIQPPNTIERAARRIRAAAKEEQGCGPYGPGDDDYGRMGKYRHQDGHYLAPAKEEQDKADHECPEWAKAGIASLDLGLELDEQGKVLTDKEIERIACEIAPQWGVGIAIEAIRYARDNGYLAPAKEEQGKVLTDEEIGEMSRLYVNSWLSAHSSHDRVHAIADLRELIEKVRDRYLAPAKEIDDYTTLLVNALRLGDADKARLVKDLAERGLVLDAFPNGYFIAPPKGSDDQMEKLQAFKDYVHQRLDEAGIPTHPPGEHMEAGCRVGQRLDIALANGSGLTVEGVMRLVDEHLRPRRSEILGHDVISGKLRFRQALEDLAENSSGNLRTDPWISVEDRLPERGAEVLGCFTPRGRQIVVRYYDGTWYDEYKKIRDIRHWMPLPATPNNTDKG